MMLQPTKEEVELRKKLLSSNDDEEIKSIRRRLKEIAIQRDKELKDCPFAH